MANERRKNRPEVESLESKALLSGASAMLHHPAAADVASTPAAQTISIHGTTHGFYVSHTANPDTGTNYKLVTSGQLTPFGPSEVVGSFQTPGFILNGKATGHLQVLSAGGTVNLKITQIFPPTPTASAAASSPIILNYDFAYTITGGTGRYHGATGSGTVDVQITPGGSGASGFTGHGQATVIFNPPATG